MVSHTYRHTAVNTNTHLSVDTRTLSTPRVHYHQASLSHFHYWAVLPTLGFAQGFSSTSHLTHLLVCSWLPKRRPRKMIWIPPHNILSTASLVRNTTKPAAETKKIQARTPRPPSSAILSQGDLSWEKENLRSCRPLSTDLPTLLSLECKVLGVQKGCVRVLYLEHSFWQENNLPCL